ncbi:NAD-dependent protein deacetylase sirtuin-7 [Pelomyxa schiedti]|nr:NAD-dependent protein deacetylase sirtuin-7 [Pelomyxa schiedti]
MAATTTTRGGFFEDWRAAHGVLGDPGWDMPALALRSDRAAREDQGGTICANEFVDPEPVLAAKVRLVASLLRKSAHCVAYCGAGLSKASGIPDYATKSENSVANSRTLVNVYRAQPTYAHHVLAAMQKAGLLWECINQNHDGLPEKAGFPQEKVNEIHGAWFDPSYPVVSFDGSLRTDFYQWMLKTESQMDMCLCLGTSLSGMNADQIPRTAATNQQKGLGQGTVIINLQQTALDALASVRIWARLDDVFKLLAVELGLTSPGVPLPPGHPAPLPPGDIYDIPYNENGAYDDSVRMRLDLREDIEVKVAPSGSVEFGKTGSILGKDPEGHYLIGFQKLNPVPLGTWWVDAALRGAVPQIPVVNVHPQVWKKESPAPALTPLPPALSRPLVLIQSHHIIEGTAHKWSLSVAPEFLGAIRVVKWKMPAWCQYEHLTATKPPFTITQSVTPPLRKLEVTGQIFLKAPHNGMKLIAKHTMCFGAEGDSVATTEVPLNFVKEDDETTDGCLLM